MFTNVDILSNKHAEFEAYIKAHKPQIICLNEILPKTTRDRTDWLNFEIPNYTKHQPSTDKINRGTVTFVHKSIESSPDVHLNSHPVVDAVWCQLKLKQETVIIGNIYRNPNGTPENSAEINNMINAACDRHRCKNILIVGDFNYREINWNNFTTPHFPSHHCSQFMETIKGNFLHQVVSENTRQRGNDESSLLDLILTNESTLISSVTYDPPLGKSDHSILLFTMKLCTTCNKPQTHTRLNFHKGDYEAMREDIASFDWKIEFEGRTVEESWSMLLNKLQKSISKHVPLKRNKPNKSHPLWFSKAAELAIKRKNRAWKKYRSSQTQWAALKYRQARNNCCSELRQIKFNIEKKIALEAKESLKSFWSYVNSCTKTDSQIPDLIKPDGESTSDDTEKAQVLNTYFSSVFTDEYDRNEAPTLPAASSCIPTLSDIQTSEKEVLQLLNEIDHTKSAGPDMLHPRLLYELRTVLTPPLTEIFNKSLLNGTLPYHWKLAKIIPIHKKGSKSLPQNYRPVSLTSVVCKLLEKIVRLRLETHLKDHNLLSTFQYGFREGRSCTSQLLSAMEDWTKSTNNQHETDIILLDFAKAFDTVPHARLINKLRAYQINGSLLKWIENFLSQRKQQVAVSNNLSELHTVTSRVPQGSVLGPTLFLLYINDLPLHISSNVRIFADDTKVYREIHNESDRGLLQDDLNSLFDWSNKWKLNFNSSKCVHMHLGKKSEATYYMKNPDLTETQIKSSECERDLGIFINQSLKPSDHITKISARASQILGCIKRSFTYLDQDMLVTLYKTIVRPILEYGSPVWSPHLQKDKIEIEKIQRRATKLIPGLKDLPYSERLRILGLPTLLYRRDRQDLIQVYLILKVNNQTFFTIQSASRLRGHSKKLVKNEHYNRDVRLYFFSQRVIQTWNSLPETVVSANTLNEFKSHLNNINWHDNKFVFP